MTLKSAYYGFGILILAIVFSCNKTKNEKTMPEKTDTIHIDSARDEIQKKTIVETDNKIIGVWSLDEQPVFEILKDSIYYIDQDKSYKYSINDSILNIYFDGFIYTGNVTVTSAKLVIKDSTKTNVYYKE